jgi:PhzF family phenazine biosynthesis protein
MKYYVVDAFASKLFEGSPTGVCVLKRWPADDILLKVAEENALPETAFCVKNANDYQIRWFAPNAEVDLCGHATLAAAYCIAHYLEQNSSVVNFNSMSGPLKVTRKGDLYELDLPIRIPEPSEISEELIQALGGSVPDEVYVSRDYFLVYDSADTVLQIKPDFAKMAALDFGDGVIITDTDFVTRAFFPKLLTNEDPVCGSAHCNLIPFWAARLGKREMVSRQLSKRGATIYCRYEDDSVKVAGQVVLYSEAELFVPELT